MEKNFREKIISGAITSPTQKKFKIELWEKHWAEIQNPTKDDENIYTAGKIIYELLSETRKKLSELYESHAPKIRSQKYLELLTAISNRDSAIIAKVHKEPLKVKNPFSATYNKNKLGNEITIDEVAHGSVDGLEKAILFAVSRVRAGKNIKEGSSPENILSFIEKEANLSQIYGMYEDYWQAILWGNYELTERVSEHKIYEVTQTTHPFEIAHEVSQLRKSKIATHIALICAKNTFTRMHVRHTYIRPTGNGKNKNFKVETLEYAPQKLQAANSKTLTATLFLEDEFPTALLNQKNEAGFSVLEALEVFRLISLLSLQFEEKFPADDSFFTVGKLQEFTVKINRQDLCLALTQATGFSYLTCSNIIEFLTYKEMKDDLWCQPFVTIENNKLCLITAACTHPVVTRLIENWLLQSNIDLQTKGTHYETKALEKINQVVASNEHIRDYNTATTKKISDSEMRRKEEIDLIFRIDDTILIGEAKSIVTTDSPISYYRTIKILEHAAEQVKRKSEAFKRNIETAFKELNWKHDKNKSYQIIPVIINSSKIYAGFSIEDIPVVDAEILSSYFEKGTFPILSRTNEKGDFEHIAWFELYDNIEKLKESLPKYLKNPPQILNDADSFELKSITVPYFNDDSYKIYFSRLTLKDPDIKTILSKKYEFEIVKSADFEKFASEMTVMI